MKRVFDDPKKIYAYKTQVTKEKSLEEAQKILEKFNCMGFQYSRAPYSNEAAIKFLVKAKWGDVLIRIDIPAIYRKYKDGTEKYLENESYRYLILLLKAKFALLEIEPIEKVFFLDSITKDGKKMEEILLNDSNLPKLLENNPES
jgi:hypothetical protein